jgi:hypothetical protein
MFDDPIAVAVVLKAIVLGWIAEDGRSEMTSALARTLANSPERK